MRLNTAVASALLSSATFVGNVYAEDATEDVSSSIEKPTFTVRVLSYARLAIPDLLP